MKEKILDKARLTELKALIEESQRIAIISHTAPDGDSIGSSLGLKLLLESYGKRNCTVIAPDAYPSYLSHIDGAAEILIHEERPAEAEEKLLAADLIFCLDFNAPSRVAGLEPVLTKATGKRVLIDHHLYPADCFDLSFSYPAYSATSELLCQIAIDMGIEEALTPKAATAFLTGIFTDTGVLYYNSSDPELYRLVAYLMERGANKTEIIKESFQSNSEGKLRFQGYAIYEKMQVLHEIKTAYIAMSEEEMQRFKLEVGDSDGLANMPLEIDGVEASVFVRENKDQIKLSFRSIGDFPVNKIAEKYFGGGGHLNAAGGEWQGSLEEAVEQLLKALQEFNPCKYK